MDTLSELLTMTSPDNAQMMADLERDVNKLSLDYMQRAYPWLYENYASKMNYGIPTPSRQRKMFAGSTIPERDYPNIINLGWQQLLDQTEPKGAHGIGMPSGNDVLWNLSSILGDEPGVLAHETIHKAFDRGTDPYLQGLISKFGSLTPRQAEAASQEDYMPGKSSILEFMIRNLVNPGLQWTIEREGGPVIKPTQEQQTILDQINRVLQEGPPKQKEIKWNRSGETQKTEGEYKGKMPNGVEVYKMPDGTYKYVNPK